MIGAQQHELNFSVLASVGNGGYGSVFKVKNNLDERVYAIKKIKLDTPDFKGDDEETMKVLKECRTLSLLDHPNILRYYGSWISRPVAPKVEKRSLNSISSKYGISNAYPLESESPQRRNTTYNQSHPFSKSIVVRATPLECLSEEGSEASQEDLHADTSPFSRRSMQECDNDDEDSFSNPEATALNDKGTVLYIQTEFCDFNLEQYLEERGRLLRKCQKLQSSSSSMIRHDMELHPLLIYEAFSVSMQLISALKYLHTKQKLIHRDLKPTNVFLNKQKSKIEVKLGDFGLVKKLRHVKPSSPYIADMLSLADNFELEDDIGFTSEDLDKATEDKKPDELKASHLRISNQYLRFSLGHASRVLGGSMLTRSVGTRLYASPEQLETSTYDFKSDVYSLAIVLLRVFSPTYTSMETIRLLEQVRNGNLRESFMEYFDLMGPVLKKALDRDPKQRPDLETIEKCLAAQCIKLFRELRFDYDSPAWAVFKSQEDNSLEVGTTMTLFEVHLVIEGEPGHKSTTLMIWHDEVLTFLGSETKSKLSFSVRDYTLITHKKRKAIALKSSIKSDLTLIFQSLEDLEMFLLYAADQGCLIY